MTETPTGPEARDPNAERIAKLNDLLRRFGVGGRVMATIGVQGLEEDAQRKVMQAIQTFDAFDAGSDPYGERDFGAVLVDGERYFFKINYFDKALEYASPDPADPAVTERVMVVMRSDEY